MEFQNTHKKKMNMIQMPFWASASGDYKSWIDILFMGGRFMDAWPWSASLKDNLAGRLNAATRLIIYISLLVSVLSIAAGQRLQGLLIFVVGLMAIGSIVLYYRDVPQSPQLSTSTSTSTVRGFSQGKKETVNNPYGNPMPYEPGIAVRSAKPPMQYFEDNCMSALYRGTDEWDEHLFFNQIPDPTLVARPVFWPQDPRPDIVSNEAACADRLCR